MQNPSLLKDSIILVTGGSSGIGRATSLAFAHSGAHVIIASRTPSQGQETVHLIAEAGGKAYFLPTDVTNEHDVQQLFSHIRETYGRLDVAINNAGREPHFGPLVDTNASMFDDTITGNLKSVWLCMKYEIALMLEHGQGSIVNIASTVAHVGMPNMSLYAAAKHGVLGLTRTSALEYATQGIRINTISPGSIETPMGERAFGSLQGYREAMAPAYPMKRIGLPEEIAQAALFLSSPAAAFITGQDLVIDGGYLAQ